MANEKLQPAWRVRFHGEEDFLRVIPEGMFVAYTKVGLINKLCLTIPLHSPEDQLKHTLSTAHHFPVCDPFILRA
ncbi:hypothetical protein ES708_03872 [subsurface metagenome]